MRRRRWAAVALMLLAVPGGAQTTVSVPIQVTASTTGAGPITIPAILSVGTGAGAAVNIPLQVTISSTGAATIMIPAQTLAIAAGVATPLQPPSDTSPCTPTRLQMTLTTAKRVTP